MSRKVALVGNDSFPLDISLGGQVVQIIRDLGDCTILTRARPHFDLFIQHCAIVLGLRCLTYDADGGASNIERDSFLIRDADEVYAFLTLEEFEQGRLSGTYWLIEKALAAGKPVRAYTNVDGALVWAGENE
jgi:hypothetical protein